MQEKPAFTRYEKFVVAILTILQFTVILDFMVLSPLGAFLMPTLNITPQQFAMVVSAYAISAGISGFLAAGFADRFDRKKLLIFFYTGFIVGTLLCGLAQSYYLLLAARVFTGIFGGVIASICYAIVTDIFRMEVRGRVMGFLQMAFAGSQVLGIPVGLYFTKVWDWHASFLMIVVVSIVVFVMIILFMKPIDKHLALRTQTNAFRHILHTVTQNRYIKGFAATILLATGGFMLMPFASAYGVNNIQIDKDDLFLLYLITGVVSMAAGPLVGKLADTSGKYKVFLWGTVLSIIIVLIYCNMGVVPFWVAALVSSMMFIGVSARMIGSQALMTAVPAPADRGAFMGINSSIQQISGGFATLLAGMIVVQTETGFLENYDILGYVVSGTMIITVIMMRMVDRMIGKTETSQVNVKVASHEPAGENSY